jgi:ADP-L-glycero-D-manno-heptose 6-epimerase
MIALTGAGGFIGSVVLGYLNKQGIGDVYLFDDLPSGNQYKNLIGKQYLGLHSTKEIVSDLSDFDCVIHIGANSSTLERDWASIYNTNVSSTRRWHDLCREQGKKFIFTSSAAVYGNGKGPLNHYAFSKQVSEQEITDGVILRLFNVYGPNEYHKARMASVVFHAYQQIKNTGSLNLFKSHHPDFKDGEQMRDFVYVKDVVNVLYFFLHHRKDAGIYNLGSGKARTFKDLAAATFQAMDIVPQINFIDTPADIRDKYQYFTEAKMQKLKSIGYDIPFHTIEQGVADYVNNYLAKNNYL